jgi:hypothetical protein
MSSADPLESRMDLQLRIGLRAQEIGALLESVIAPKGTVLRG